MAVVLACTAGLLGACGGGGGAGGSGAASNNNGVVPPNSVSGTVTLNGQPMAGVTVSMVNTNSNPSTFYASTTTDANGHYSFSGLGAYLPTDCTNCAENYQIWASMPGTAFIPVMASDPAWSTAAYQWNPLPSNWTLPIGAIGAAVSRAGFNGNFSNPNGGSPMTYTVINYNSTPGNSITGANFQAYDGSNAPIGLAASGQASSYASGDDGSLHKGAAWPAQRFADNQDGTITDRLTGLVWLKNAGCLAPDVWANAVAMVQQLASGACGLSDGSMAGQWRLPNVVELESLVDVSASSPALTVGHPFSKVSAGLYWTSTAYFGGQEGTTNAWVVRMGDGSYVNDSTSNLMATSKNAIWAVRGGSGAVVKLPATGAYAPFAKGDDGSLQIGTPLTYPRMRDNGDGTVTDTVTGLVWLKHASCIQQTWAGAVAAVNALASGQCGLSDGSKAGSWRMPNRKEMLSLQDRGINNHADYFDESFVSNTAGISSQPSVFTNMVGFQFYWTSSTDAADTTLAWTVFSCDYGVYPTAKAGMGYTLAVR
ncbi:MAG: DUF1566 domain-containing protein [Burkholderiaceae bacterium]|nr:DUF1566 domain-containing protein [Burkholderiaceae bacterium]